MKTYENQDLGIVFNYPSEWEMVYNCRVKYGVDVFLRQGFTNFGIIRVSDKIKNEVISNTKTLKQILRSTVQINEVIVDDIHSNKYQVEDSQTATMMLHKKGDAESIMIVERTLVEHNYNHNQLFIVVFEDIPENFESGKSQDQIKEIFDSFRFL
ncbi:MAG: hypothetical protein R2685_14225 [Candidatus Nitrosocosmicus sp.]|nr:hypothetical protein [Candidatus Nitrosocosmicus sp.]